MHRNLRVKYRLTSLHKATNQIKYYIRRHTVSYMSNERIKYKRRHQLVCILARGGSLGTEGSARPLHPQAGSFSGPSLYQHYQTEPEYAKIQHKFDVLTRRLVERSRSRADPVVSKRLSKLLHKLLFFCLHTGARRKCTFSSSRASYLPWRAHLKRQYTFKSPPLNQVTSTRQGEPIL